MGEDVFKALDRLVFADSFACYTGTGTESCFEGQLCRFPLHDTIHFLCIGRFEVVHDNKHRLAYYILQVARNRGCDIKDTSTGAKAARTYITSATR